MSEGDLILTTRNQLIDVAEGVHCIDQVFDCTLESVLDVANGHILALPAGADLRRCLLHRLRVGQVTVGKAGLKLDSLEDALEAVIQRAVTHSRVEILEEITGSTAEGAVFKESGAVHFRIGGRSIDENLAFTRLILPDQTPPLFICLPDETDGSATKDGDSDIRAEIHVVLSRNFKEAEQRTFQVTDGDFRVYIRPVRDRVQRQLLTVRLSTSAGVIGLVPNPVNCAVSVVHKLVVFHANVCLAVVLPHLTENTAQHLPVVSESGRRESRQAGVVHRQPVTGKDRLQSYTTDCQTQLQRLHQRRFCSSQLFVDIISPRAAADQSRELRQRRAGELPNNGPGDSDALSVAGLPRGFVDVHGVPQVDILRHVFGHGGLFLESGFDRRFRGGCALQLPEKALQPFKRHATPPTSRSCA